MNRTKIKRLGKVYNGSTPNTGNTNFWDGDINWVTPADLTGDKYISKGSRSITELGRKNANLVTLPKNTVLLSSRAPIGKVALAKEPIHTNQGFKNIVTNENIMISEFLYYILLISEERLNLLGRGSTFKELSKNDFENFEVPCPSIETQRKVVNQLNNSVSRINLVKLETKKSIEELKKYKQSIITEAVTKGLDSSVEMKDSMIEWVGNTPIHWESRKISNYFSQVKNKNEDLLEENLLSLSYGNIVRRNINSSDGLLPANFKGYNIVEAGDIVLRMTDLQNDKVSLRTGFVTEKGIITSAYITIRTHQSKDVFPKFVQLYLHSFDIYKGFYGMGSGVRQNVNYNDIKQLQLLVPPFEEQKKIVSFINEKTSKIEEIIEDKVKVIEELENYKKSIIFEYITGEKIV